LPQRNEERDACTGSHSFFMFNPSLVRRVDAWVVVPVQLA